MASYQAKCNLLTAKAAQYKQLADLEEMIWFTSHPASEDRSAFIKINGRELEIRHIKAHHPKLLQAIVEEVKSKIDEIERQLLRGKDNE